MKKIIINFSIASMLFITACKNNEIKPENKPSNETELITTLIIELTDSQTNTKNHFVFRDLDGDGGNAPVNFDSIFLKPNTTYNCHLIVLDESQSKSDTVSNEIFDERDDHLFVFTKEQIDAVIYITDKDNNNLPLGLMSKWYSKTASNGFITIALKHQPNIKNGSSQIGETDIEIKFPCRIE
jgi:hypothetical protein